MSAILLQHDGPVATITLNRPDKLNALSSAVEQELAETLRRLGETRVLVIRGAGRAFCAGADVNELGAATPASALDYYARTGQVYEQLAELAIPSIAQIHGWCVGGGLELALACDLRVATADARFWFPEVERGILPSSGGTARVTRSLGAPLARRLILLGEKLDAPTAVRLGLVHEIGDAQLVAEWAGTLASRSRAAIQVTRTVIAAAADGPQTAAIAIERLAYATLSGIDATE